MDSKLQRLSQLPSLPTVAVQLLHMFSDPEVSISDVVCVLRMDPALSGKILKAANTSRFGMKRPVCDLQRAVVLLGKKSVMALALGFSLAEASMSRSPHANLYSDFWFQSLVRGCAASLLAENYTTKVDAAEAFTIGLLARIGRLAMLGSDRERFVACIEKANETGAPLDEIESQCASITSRQVTLYLVREWKLPEHCLNAINDMNASMDEACANRVPGTVDLTDILRIASAFADFFSGENRGLAIAKAYELCCSILGITEEQVNLLVDRVREALDRHSSLFAVDMSKVGSPMELLSQAMGQLSALAASAAMNRDDPPGGYANHEIQEENGRLRKRVMELTASTMTDPLTSLYNRGYLNQSLNDRTQRAIEQGSSVGLLFLDVDYFKQVNDTHGHLVGDEVLKLVAQLIRESVREGDVVTRYGGEEFVVLTSDQDVTSFARRAEMIRQRIESTPLRLGDLILNVTASIGGCLASPTPENPDFPIQILEAADAAMYRSKRSGRNRSTIVEELIAVTPPGRRSAASEALRV